MTRAAMTRAVPLAEAVDPSRFGAKAAMLARACAAGLPVPSGFSLDLATAAAVATGAVRIDSSVPRPWAVRSSAPDEDGAGASFAGQFRTVLGVGTAGLAAAVRQVLDSAAGAERYRGARGLPAGTGVAVVVQTLVPARSAGVLFTRDPLDGSVATVLEAAWGLGTAVVDGLVVPDRVRVAGGTPTYEPGTKDVECVLDGDRVHEREITGARVDARCLADADVLRLVDLGAACEDLLGGPADVEWAIDGDGTLWLLQARPITTMTG